MGRNTPTTTFRGWCIDPVRRSLTAPDGSPVALVGRAFDVLCHLVKQRPRVVGKNELLAAVWPGRVVEENNLTQAISTLRRVFGSRPGDHEFIVTAPGRGYAFVAEPDADVTGSDPADADAVAGVAALNTRHTSDTTVASSPMATAPPPVIPLVQPPRMRSVLGAALLSALVLAGMGWWFGGRSRLVTPGLHADPTSRSVPSRSRVGTAPPAVSRVPLAGDATTPVTRKPATLAVLPFRVLGASPADPLLEYGITDTLIAQLSGNPQLRVLSLAATQIYHGQVVDPLRAGSSLGADYVIEGSVQKRGVAVRVSARLLHLPDGRALWTDSVDQSLAQVFGIQDRLASSLAAALPHGTVRQQYRSPCDGDNPDAYRAYLRGRFIAHRPDPRTLDTAIAEFRRAVALDPRCARAWAAMAFARRALVMAADRDPKIEFPAAKREIARALAHDPDSAEAYAAQGFVQFWYDWDWAGSERSLRHAIALDPDSAEAHLVLAHLLLNLGRNGEAVIEARRAAALDPLSPVINTLVASFVSTSGDQIEARKRYDQVLALEPDFWIALTGRSVQRRLIGDLVGARRDAERAVQETGGNARSLFTLALYDVRTAQPDGARRILADLRKRARSRYVPASIIASIELLLGDTAQALDALELGYRQKDYGMAFLQTWFGPLQNEPRYVALIERLRLPMPATALETAHPVSGRPHAKHRRAEARRATGTRRNTRSENSSAAARPCDRPCRLRVRGNVCAAAGEITWQAETPATAGSRV